MIDACNLRPSNALACARRWGMLYAKENGKLPSRYDENLAAHVHITEYSAVHRVKIRDAARGGAHEWLMSSDDVKALQYQLKQKEYKINALEERISFLEQENTLFPRM